MKRLYASVLYILGINLTCHTSLLIATYNQMPIISYRYNVNILNHGQYEQTKILIQEPLSKRFGLVKVKAGENFNHRNTFSISRIKI